MRPEYLLAPVVRGVLEANRPDLLGKILRATSGLDVEEADRVPRKVLLRLLRHPMLFARLCSSPSILRRAYEAYTTNGSIEGSAVSEWFRFTPLTQLPYCTPMRTDRR
jgi:hypothetical protein